MKIVFILPGGGGGGGHHSVVQETLALRRLGADVAIAASRERYDIFSAHYPELAPLGVPTPLFSNVEDLTEVVRGADLAVATTAASSIMLAGALEQLAGASKVRPAYYIQDYEPLFFTPTTPEWEQSRKSYTVLGEALLFAKTRWLCGMVQENHGLSVERVAPGVDHASFFPGPRLSRPGRERITISAMIRPKTPRRAPKRTARILERLGDLHGDRVELISFGCAAEELEASGLRLSPRIEHRGALSRTEVGATLRESDLFLDLSDYQAFGLTGLEAMACGCLPMLPLFGGAVEYARHWENAWLVDTRSDEAILDAVGEALAADGAVRRRMQAAAIGAALDYSVDKAALSEYEAFSRFLG